MKKILICILAFMTLSIFASGCSGTNNLNPNSSEVIANPDPPAITSEDRSLNEVLQIEEDTDYDELYVELESDVYKIDDEYINCKLINKHHGKGFYFYELPYIEKKINDNWVRLLNNSDRKDYAEWLFCGIPDKKDISFTADVKIRLSDVEPSVDEGDYRLVVFTAENVLYADFRLEK